MAIRIASDFLSLYPPMMPAKQNGGKISRNGGKKIITPIHFEVLQYADFPKVRKGAFRLYSSLETRCGVAGMIYCYSFYRLSDFVSYLCSGIGREV